MLICVGCSSDTCIKVWNTGTEECATNLILHSDYVKALAHARSSGLIVSAGLDKDVYIWDLEGSRSPISQMQGVLQ